jgi:hypothetical protein
MAPTRTEKAENSESKPTLEIDIPLYESTVPSFPTINVRIIPIQWRLSPQGNKPSGDRHVQCGLCLTIDEKIVVDGPSGSTLKVDMTAGTAGTGVVGMVIVGRSMQRGMGFETHEINTGICKVGSISD